MFGKKKSYLDKLKDKVEEYDTYYKRNPVPKEETQWMDKDILMGLLGQKGRYAIEIGFRPDGTVVWRESLKQG